MRRVAHTLTVLVLACGIVYGQEQAGPNYEHLKCYEKLIGTWVYDGPLQEDVPTLAGEGAKLVVHLSWEWILDKNVVENNWSIEMKNGLKRSAKGLIGWDTSDKRIISGSMTSRGSHSVGTTVYDQATKTWTTRSEGADAQGRATSATVVHKLIDPDTLVFQSTDRQGGDLTGDSPKYTFKRVKQ